MIEYMVVSFADTEIRRKKCYCTEYYKQQIADTCCSKRENKTVVMSAETCINNKERNQDVILEKLY